MPVIATMNDMAIVKTVFITDAKISGFGRRANGKDNFLYSINFPHDLESLFSEAQPITLAHILNHYYFQRMKRMNRIFMFQRILSVGQIFYFVLSWLRQCVNGKSWTGLRSIVALRLNLRGKAWTWLFSFLFTYKLTMNPRKISAVPFWHADYAEYADFFICGICEICVESRVIRWKTLFLKADSRWMVAGNATNV